MVYINENFKLLKRNYLFAEVANRVKKYKEAHPEARIIRLGIGDVTEPLTDSVIKELENAVKEMSKRETFQGYPPYEGYEFLRKAISDFDFKRRGIDISPNEIYISTGAKEDTANFQELFSIDCKVAIPDPVYPVYVDSNVMAGRSGVAKDKRYSKFVYLECKEENNFKPELPSEKVDIIYLCFPNNPTGQVLTKVELKKWVDYAIENNAIILYDAAYEAYVREEGIPKSIYEIEGAKKVAVEFRSLSKTAGFTGTRCAYTIIPQELVVYDKEKNKYPLGELWLRRQSTKFNGVAYIIQKGAAAVFTEKGQQEVNKLISYYLENAKIIYDTIRNLGLKVYGGVNSPYIWFKVPEKFDSWSFFDYLLNECQIVSTPGEGFGQNGEGFIRLSAFGNREDILEATERLKKLNI
ncbi:MAG: LL-diaminopimelate aminotransferase [Brevinematia bacterium]